VAGRRYEAELHIVHERFEEEGEGPLYAVIAIMFDSTKDIESGLLNKLNLQQLNITRNGTLANMTETDLQRA
jgi:hypothetical protein